MNGSRTSSSSPVRKLLAVNGVLLTALIALLLIAPAQPDANAQPTVSVRARGEYTMVSGRTTQGNVNAVYIVDAANQEMVALRWEPGKKSFVGIGYRSLDADAKAQPGR